MTLIPKKWFLFVKYPYKMVLIFMFFLYQLNQKYFWLRTTNSHPKIFGSYKIKVSVLKQER